MQKERVEWQEMIGVDGHWQQHLTPPQTDFTLRATTVETPGWSAASEALGTTETRTEMEPAQDQRLGEVGRYHHATNYAMKIAAMDEYATI